MPAGRNTRSALIWRYENVRLFIFSKALFATIPPADIDESGKQMIATSVQQAGGKVR